MPFSILLSAIIAYSALSHVHLHRQTIHYYPGYDHGRIPAIEQVTEPFKKRLRGESKVGYITDQDPNKLPGLQDYLMAQHSMVPVILVRSDQPEYIIANYIRTSPSVFQSQHPEFRIISETGTSWFLLKRTRSP